MAFSDIFEESRKKLQNYFGLGRPGLGTFGQQIKPAVNPIVNFVRQNPSPFKFAQRRIQTPQVQKTIKPAVNFFRQNPTPYSFVNRNVVKPAIDYQRNQIRIANNLANRAITGINTYADRQRQDPLYQTARKIHKYNPASWGGQTATMFAKEAARDLVRLPLQIRASITGKTIKADTPLKRAILGKDIETLGQRRQYNVGELKKYGLSDKWAGRIGTLGTGLAIAGVGLDASDIARLGGKKLLTSLAKEVDPKIIKKMLPNISDNVARKIAKAKNVDEIEGLLKAPKKGTDALSNEARKLTQADLDELQYGIPRPKSTKPVKVAPDMPSGTRTFKTTDVQGNPVEQVIFKKTDSKLTEPAKNKLFNEMPEYNGWEKVFKPYGEQGAGFYYTRKATPNKIPLKDDAKISKISQQETRIPIKNQKTTQEKDVVNQVADDIRRILDRGKVKERSFGKRVKLSKNTPKEVKELVGGNYVVKSNKELQKDAAKLIKTNIEAADELAINPRNATDIEVGNQLIAHYQSMGQYQKAADIANSMNKSLTEGGQFVQAASLYDKTTPAGIQRFAQSEVEAFNRTHPNKKISIDDNTADKLFRKAQKIQKMSEGRERNIATAELFNDIADIIPTSGWKKFITLWKAGLLTSFRTHERNLLGNTLNALGEMAKDPVAAISDIVMATRTGERTKTATLQGTLSGGRKGLSTMKDFVYKGFDPEKTIEKFDIKRVNWGKSKAGKVAKSYTDAVFRILGAADKPFYKSALARSLYDQAGAKAINAGKRGNKEFIEKLVANPTEDMMKVAIRDAETAVFQQSTLAGNILTGIKNKIKGGGELAEAAGEFFLPFTQVPSGVGSQLLSYSPAGLTQGAINAARTMITKNKGLQRQAAEQIGRGIVGTGLMALGYQLYNTGNMTGGYPESNREREQWKLEGKQENSIKIDGKWRKLSTIGPQASILVTGAQIAEAQKEGDAGVLKTAGAAGSEFLDQPFIQGMSVPLDVLRDPERNVQRFKNQAVSGLIPNFIKDIAKGTDEYKREAETVGQALQKSIPYARNKLTPMRDVYGEPLPEEGGVLRKTLDLFNSITPRGDNTTKEVGRLLEAGYDSTPTKLYNSQTIAGEKLKLKNEELDLIETKAGPKIKQAFDEIIQSPEYQKLDDEEKTKRLDKVVKDVRAVAKLEAASELGLVDKDKLAEKADKLTKDQKALLAGEDPTFAKAKQDYEVDEQISYLSGSYGLLELYKENGDYENWNKEAQNLLNLYNYKLENAETEKDKVYWKNKIINHLKNMQKYASYGGFTKGSGGGSGKKKIPTLSMPESVTSLQRIPIRQAKKPTFSTGKISVKAPQVRKLPVKGITKEYLSKLR